MTKAEIREFNSKVEYNESVASWIVVIISCIIAFPMIVIDNIGDLVPPVALFWYR